MSDIITVKLTDVWSKYLSGIWDLLVTAYTDYFVAFLSLTVAYFTEDWVGIIIAQTVGFIGMFLSIISFQSKSYQKIIWIRVASEFVFALQYFLLGAYTGMATNLTSCVTNSIYRERKKHGKSVLSSKLTEIEGIGKKKADILLLHFRTVSELSKASVETLSAVKGISKNDAKRIYDYFHNQ